MLSKETVSLEIAPVEEFSRRDRSWGDLAFRSRHEIGAREGVAPQ